MHWQTALDILYKVPLRSLLLDAVCCSAPISVSEKDALWQTRLRLLGDMVNILSWPNMIIYNAATSMCEKGTSWTW